MELWLPIFLAAMGIIFLGLPAGLYLSGKWLRHRKSIRLSTVWSLLWIVGWLFLAVNVSLILAMHLATLTFILGLLVVSPMVWLIASFEFRKWERENKQSLRPDYGEEQEGVWPPPPNVLKESEGEKP